MGVLCRLWGRMVSQFPLLIPGHDDSLFIPGQKMLPCLYQVMTFSCLYQVKRCFLAYTRSQDFLVYTRSKDASLLIPGEARYSHRCPGCGGRFLAGIMLKSDSWAVCVGGAWAIVTHVFGMILGSE